MRTFSSTYENRAQTSHLTIFDIETGEAEVVATFPRVIEAPNWTQDGRFLIYNSYGKIYRFELATGEIEEIETGVADTCNNDHVLSPDGKRIAISSGEADDMTSRIFIHNFESGETRLVVSTTPSYLHGWSPDGTTFAYCAKRSDDEGEENWDVYTYPVAGGKEVRLTFAEGLNDGPEYSPDGRKIWFNSVRSGRMQVYVMDVDGSNQTQMTFDTSMNAWFPHISPDAQKVVYIAYHEEDLLPGKHLPDLNVEIRMIPAEGGEEKTLVKLFGGQGSMNVNSWAPDSRRFAYVSYEQ